MKLRPNMLMKPDDESGGGGGGTPPNNEAAPDLAARIAALEAENASLKAAKPNNEPKPDDDLIAKAKRERESKDRTQSDATAIEAALRFTMSADTFLKENSGLLPKEVADIFEAANKEKFASEKQKADAIKAGVVQSFFKVQSNLDLLTPGLKSQLEDYLKLTKDGKEQEATRIFDSIFEPTFAMIKRLKKAEQISKGFSSNGSSDDAYKEKMIRGSRKHHLGEKV